MDPVIVTVLVLTVAMIIGPIAMVRPTLAQKRRDALRASARERGLGVTFRRPPQMPTDTEAPGNMPVYTRAIKGGACWLLVRTRYAHEANLNQWWQFVGAKPAEQVRSALSARLPDLPASVAAVSSGERELAVYWHEQGGEEALAQIDEFLKAVSDN